MSKGEKDIFSILEFNLKSKQSHVNNTGRKALLKQMLNRFEWFVVAYYTALRVSIQSMIFYPFLTKKG